MTLENLAERVKEMRGLQVRRDKAKLIGRVKEAKLLAAQCAELEMEVDKILMDHFYTPIKEQSNLFK